MNDLNLKPEFEELSAPLFVEKETFGKSWTCINCGNYLKHVERKCCRFHSECYSLCPTCDGLESPYLYACPKCRGPLIDCDFYGKCKWCERMWLIKDWEQYADPFNGELGI